MRIIGISFNNTRKKMRNLIIALTCTLFLSTSVMALQSSAEESEINRLVSPTFYELQSEVIWGTITCYRNMSNDLIEHALNKHFERIEFMSFDNCTNKGDK